MSGLRTPWTAALAGQLLGLLAAEGALPVSTPALWAKLAAGDWYAGQPPRTRPAYGDMLRLLNWLAANGQVEKRAPEGMRARYWRLDPAAVAAGEITIPRRKPGPRSAADSGVATFRTSVRIYGQAQIDTFRAMCALEGRRPHELAYDIVLEAIRAGQANHEVQELAAALTASRAHRARQPGSRRDRRAMLRLLTGGGS